MENLYSWLVAALVLLFFVARYWIGHRSIGHSICADVCPVGAITMVMAKASASADMPALTPEYETSIPNLFIAGELGGLALIKNAVNQGRDCVDLITARAPQLREVQPSVNGHSDVVDVIIVGAGPGASARPSVPPRTASHTSHWSVKPSAAQSQSIRAPGW